MAVVKLEPPSLLTEAIISVFNVRLVNLSSNTTILLVVGTLVEAKGSDIIVVDKVGAEEDVLVIKTYPFSATPCTGPEPLPPCPSLVHAT